MKRRYEGAFRRGGLSARGPQGPARIAARPAGPGLSLSLACLPLPLPLSPPFPPPPCSFRPPAPPQPNSSLLVILGGCYSLGQTMQAGAVETQKSVLSAKRYLSDIAQV